MMTGRRTGPRRLATGAALTLAALVAACACRPDTALHQQPAGLSALPESLLVGIACIEILPQSMQRRCDPWSPLTGRGSVYPSPVKGVVSVRVLN